MQLRKAKNCKLIGNTLTRWTNTNASIAMFAKNQEVDCVLLGIFMMTVNMVFLHYLIELFNLENKITDSEHRIVI